jgi:hypothetical protein
MIQNPVPDDSVLEDWLDSPMSEEKKKEMEEYRKEWEKARQDAIEHKKNNEYWKFLVSTWSEQSCGFKLMLMMTQATPKGSDFDRDGENPYVPINTQEERAICKFKEVFDEYYTYDLHFVTREEFFSKYGEYLPPKLLKLKDELCAIEYHSELYFNFS